MRFKTIIAITTVLVASTTSVALAGGSVWHFDHEYQPGDVVESTTMAAWGRDPNLGTPDDGPFLVYLVPAEVSPDWPGIPSGGLLVGTVEIDQTSYRDERSQNATATARFEIPAVPPGEYQILHCNDPCTTTLGDITGGWGLDVVAGPGGRIADDVAADVRARVGLEASVSQSSDPPNLTFDAIWMATTALLVVLLLGRLVVGTLSRGT